MDMIKIGKFISECRKQKNLTQLELAEKLNVTDRAISKWECGRSMPDSSIMLELCKILGISVNELLTGERLDMKDYDKQAEENLLELKKQKEEADNRLLRIEIVMVSFGIALACVLVMVASYVAMETWLRIVLIVFAYIAIFAMAFVGVRIEQIAGYYECQKCHHRYVPTYAQVNWSMHVGRTRYMKCPKCGERSWNKKVLSAVDDNENDNQNK